MSQSTHKLPLATAEKLAGAIVECLRDGCERIEVAGSIRRRRPEVGDLEIVAIPKAAANLFGEDDDTVTPLDLILGMLIMQQRLVKVKGGKKYKQFDLPRHGCKLDLFLCTKDTWGSVFTIRTGPASFSHRLVTKASQGGLCPNDVSFTNGRLYRGDEVMDTPEEQDVFAALGMEWIEPKERA